MLLGFILCYLIISPNKPFNHDLGIKSLLAIGIGIGISSLSYSIWIMFFSTISRGFVFLDITILIVALGYFVIHRSYYFNKKEHHSLNATHRKEKSSWILKYSFFTLLILSTLSFIFLSLREPHGGWDGWAIWNTHARFLFRGIFHWKDIFSPLLDAHNPDYPWLVPATVARYWNYLGNETTLIPIFVSSFFTFATVGLLFFGLKKFRDKNRALLGGIVLLGTPFFLANSWSQGADIPLGFFFLATFLLLVLYENDENPKLLILAGLTAGLSAWTKNEGMLFILAVVIAKVVVSLWQGKSKKVFHELLLFGIGLTPSLLVLFYFKWTLSPPNEYTAGLLNEFTAALHAQTTTAKLFDGSRYFQVFGYLYHQFSNRVWNWFPLFLIFYSLVQGIKIKKEDKAFLAISFITLFIMLIGYILVMITTPSDLKWNLDTAFPRLLLQLWPLFLFNYFLMVPVPKLFSKNISTKDQQQVA